MKLNLSKNWYKKHAEHERIEDVSAGFFCIDRMNTTEIKPESSLTLEQENPRLAFGRLINLWRRKKGFSMEKLAEKAQIDLAELIAIEQDFRFIPEPRTVYQLANTLSLPTARLLQLSGNMAVRDAHLGEEAVRFAARSESVEKLTKDEQRALEEFVKYLSAG